jgi:hypothetical protein
MPPASRFRGQIFIEPGLPLFYWTNASRPSASLSCDFNGAMSIGRQSTAQFTAIPPQAICREEICHRNGNDFAPQSALKSTPSELASH